MNILILNELELDNKIIGWAVLQDKIAGGYPDDKKILFTDEMMADFFPKFKGKPIVIEHSNEKEKDNVYGVILDVFQNKNGITYNNKLIRDADFKWIAKFEVDSSKMSKEELKQFKGVSNAYNIIEAQTNGEYNGIDLEKEGFILPTKIEALHLALTNSPRYSECQEIITNSIVNSIVEPPKGENLKNDSLIMNEETKKEISSIVNSEISSLKSSIIDEVKNSLKEVLNKVKNEDKEDKKEDEMKKENSKTFNYEGEEYSEEDVKNALKMYKNKKSKNSDEEDDKKEEGKKTENSFKSENKGMADHFDDQANKIHNSSLKEKSYEEIEKEALEKFNQKVLNSYKK